MQVKDNKASDLDDIQAEHIRNSSLNLYRDIAGLFTGLIKHGCVPSNFRETAIILILKDQAGDRNSPDNYRGIAISSVLGKTIKENYHGKT